MSSAQRVGTVTTMLDHLGANAFVLPPLAHMMDGEWGAGWGIGMMAAMILFWVLVIVGVVWLVRYLVVDRDRTSSGDHAPGEALRVLERRFAEGEINGDEFHERRKTLEEGRSS